MSKVRKNILSITVTACLLGLGLILAGLASGGLQDLVRSSATSTKMAKQEETYDNIHSFFLNFVYRIIIGNTAIGKPFTIYFYQIE